MNLKTAVQIAYLSMEARPPLAEIAKLYVDEEEFNRHELGYREDYCVRCQMPIKKA